MGFNYIRIREKISYLHNPTLPPSMIIALLISPPCRLLWDVFQVASYMQHEVNISDTIYTPPELYATSPELNS